MSARNCKCIILTSTVILLLCIVICKTSIFIKQPLLSDKKIQTSSSINLTTEEKAWLRVHPVITAKEKGTVLFWEKKKNRDTSLFLLEANAPARIGKLSFESSYVIVLDVFVEMVAVLALVKNIGVTGFEPATTTPPA